jgi:hypothetical protein
LFLGAAAFAAVFLSVSAFFLVTSFIEFLSRLLSSIEGAPFYFATQLEGRRTSLYSFKAIYFRYPMMKPMRKPYAELPRRGGRAARRPWIYLTCWGRIFRRSCSSWNGWRV